MLVISKTLLNIALVTVAVEAGRCLVGNTRQPFGIKMCSLLCKDIRQCSSVSYITETLSCIPLNVSGMVENGFYPGSADQKCNPQTEYSRAIFTRTEGRRKVFQYRRLTERPDDKDKTPLNVQTTVSKYHRNHSCGNCKRLITAAKKGDTAHVRNYVSKCPKYLNCRDGDGLTALMHAVQKGPLEVVDILVKKGCNTRSVDKWGLNCLHHAARAHGHLQVVKYIVDHSEVDIDFETSDGWTPFVMALTYGNKETALCLARRGCNLATDKWKQNILHIACKYGRVGMIRYILNKGIPGVDIESKERYGLTPVMIAARNGHREVVKILVEEGSNLNVVDNEGNNILHLACWKQASYTRLVKLLISLGVKTEKNENRSGITPVQKAEKLNLRSILALFKRKT